MVKVSNEFALHVPTIFLTALEIHKIDLKNPLISKEKYKSSLTQKSQSHFFLYVWQKMMSFKSKSYELPGNQWGALEIEQ